MESKTLSLKCITADDLTSFGPDFILFGGLILNRSEQREDDSGLRVDSHCRDHDLSAALHDVGPRKNHGVAVDALLHVIRFARERGLVHFEIIALENHAIGGKQIAVFDLEEKETTFSVTCMRPANRHTK